ncbi:MAG: hypothetical protein KGK30_08235, partial [Elusimicrobia bacterium]|nr:hypothetical protein [Elusimicrobiota bacterium]
MRIFDAAIPRLLRYDLSRDDVIKWVLFTRQMLAVVLVSVVLTAGLSAALSIRQTQSVLEASLKAQARATAQSVAKAAFVPLTLEDD